jgi:hypothetical protein
MVDPEASRESARSLLQRAATTPAGAKFGALHAWAFDVPPWAEFFNAPKGALRVSEPPYAAIADKGWMVFFEVGHNPRR